MISVLFIRILDRQKSIFFYKYVLLVYYSRPRVDPSKQTVNPEWEQKVNQDQKYNPERRHYICILNIQGTRIKALR